MEGAMDTLIEGLAPDLKKMLSIAGFSISMMDLYEV